MDSSKEQQQFPPGPPPSYNQASAPQWQTPFQQPTPQPGYPTQQGYQPVMQMQMPAAVVQNPTVPAEEGVIATFPFHTGPEGCNCCGMKPILGLMTYCIINISMFYLGGDYPRFKDVQFFPQNVSNLGSEMESSIRQLISDIDEDIAESSKPSQNRQDSPSNPKYFSYSEET